jgi:cyclic nucleotide-binding protein
VRIDRSVTAISWIPSEAIRGTTRLPFDLHIGHYDDPPPDRIESVEHLEALAAQGAFRFANHLRAWIEVEDGAIVATGHAGRSYISPTLMRLGRLHMAFQPTSFPDLRPDPETTATSVRFVQTAGGRPGVPAPRHVKGRPFLQWEGPNVWTSVALTINTDGTSTGELTGASTFPRHWVYDEQLQLVGKSRVIDFDDWYRHAFDEHSPWGDEETPAFVTMAESALERQLSTTIMRAGARPKMRKVGRGAALFEQGETGHELYLLLDGVMQVDVDGEPIAELGPGAVIGERALLEGGARTATVRAATDCRLAVADAAQVDRDALAQLAGEHRREDA